VKPALARSRNAILPGEPSIKIEEGLKSVREGRVVDGEEAMAELIGELKPRRNDEPVP
jgi:hypothetical protein